MGFKMIEVPSYGEIEVADTPCGYLTFTKSHYSADGNLAITAHEENGAPYCHITTNIEGVDAKEPYGILDTNNLPSQLVDWLYSEGFIEEVREQVPSGFCVFPVVRFSQEFLNHAD